MSAAGGDGGAPWWREPTRRQWRTFIAVVVGWILDAFDFTIFLLAMPHIAKELGVTHVATATSITLTLLMRLLGGVIAGAAADRFGRKLPLMISIVWFALCDGAVALAPTFTWVLVLRTLFGFGMGAEWTAGSTLVMESWPARSRGLASGILQGSWAVGYLLASQVFAVVLPTWGWRPLFALAALPALLVIPIRTWVDESPEWGRAQAVRPPAPARELLAPAMLKNLVWASLFLALGFGAYYALTSLYPTFLKERGYDPRGIGNLVSLFNVGMLAGAITSGMIVVRRGITAAVAIPTLLMLAALPIYTGFVGPIALGALAGGLFGAGISGVTPALLAELFPSRIRGRASGIVYHVGAALAAFVPPIVAALPDRAGLSLGASMLTVTAACELALLASLFLRPAAPAPDRVPTESAMPGR
ncbi:MFS transporter [Myxococcota bacterium]|nr:MFS transporter [Myxococcota bacterium]